MEEHARFSKIMGQDKKEGGGELKGMILTGDDIIKSWYAHSRMGSFQNAGVSSTNPPPSFFGPPHVLHRQNIPLRKRLLCRLSLRASRGEAE